MIFVLTFVVACIASVIATKYIYHQPAALFGYRVVKILTDSMSPRISANSYILVRNIEGKDVKEGDIVVHTPAYGDYAGMTMTHLCVRAPYWDEALQQTCILTQGTKAGAPVDDPVPIANVQSVYVASFGKAGGFFDFLISKWGVVVLVALPSLVVVFLQIGRMVKAVVAKPDAEAVKAEAARIEAERNRKQQEQALELLREGENGDASVQDTSLADVMAFIARERAKGGVAQTAEAEADNSPSAEAKPQAAAQANVESAPSGAQNMSAEINNVLAFIAKQKAMSDKKEDE